MKIEVAAATVDVFVSLSKEDSIGGDMEAHKVGYPQPAVSNSGTTQDDTCIKQLPATAADGGQPIVIVKFQRVGIADSQAGSGFDLFGDRPTTNVDFGPKGCLLLDRGTQRRSDSVRKSTVRDRTRREHGATQIARFGDDGLLWLLGSPCCLASGARPFGDQNHGSSLTLIGPSGRTLPRPVAARSGRERTGDPVADLKGSKTEENLRAAFAAESQANSRYLHFALKADVEGYPEIATLFRSIAEGENGHAFGHLDFLTEIADPATGEPADSTEDCLKSAIAGEIFEQTEMYPSFSETARQEGFDEIAEWMENLARAEKAVAERLTEGLSFLR